VKFRNLFECLFSWHVKYATEKELQNADAIIAFSFGQTIFGPDSSDWFLIRKAEKIFSRYEIPIIAQWEIGEHITNGVIHVIKKSRFPEKWFDTHEVAYQANEMCKQKNLTNVLVLAHPDHAWRCKKVLQKMGLNVVGVINTDGCPYDPLSRLKWTISWSDFIFREFLVRLMYLAQGKI
jgi:uncharacterized SAM-binding protein YcdF (DUF218 family)